MPRVCGPCPSLLPSLGLWVERWSPNSSRETGIHLYLEDHPSPVQVQLPLEVQMLSHTFLSKYHGKKNDISGASLQH